MCRCWRGVCEAGEAGVGWKEAVGVRNARIECEPRGSENAGDARWSAAAAPPGSATRSCCSCPHTCRRTPLSPLLPSHLVSHLCLRRGLLLAHLGRCNGAQLCSCCVVFHTPRIFHTNGRRSKRLVRLASATRLGGSSVWLFSTRVDCVT